MTKKELSQLYYLNREIKMLKKDLTKLETAVGLKSPNITGLPSGHGVDRAELLAEMSDIAIIIKCKLEQVTYEHSRLLRYINTIDDSLMRQILTYRYVNRFTWQQVANSLGETDESFPRKKHDTFLNKMCK